MDADGLVPEALRQAITAKAAGKTIKFLYTIPNFHNPAGVTLSRRRRGDPRDLPARGHPDPRGQPLRPARLRRASPCARCAPTRPRASSTSARSPRPSRPGFRVGWALAPHTVREKLVLAQESATLCPPQFSQMAVSAYLANDWQGQIKQFREMYRERRDAMVDALRPDARRVPVERARRRLLRLAHAAAGGRRQGDAAAGGHRPRGLRPGTAFFADGFGSTRCGSSFCYPTPERIREGVAASPACSRPSWSCARRSTSSPARELGRIADGPRRPRR